MTYPSAASPRDPRLDPTFKQDILHPRAIISHNCSLLAEQSLQSRDRYHPPYCVRNSLDNIPSSDLEIMSVLMLVDICIFPRPACTPCAKKLLYDASLQAAGGGF
jgi:hypothetical protein